MDIGKHVISQIGIHRLPPLMICAQFTNIRAINLKLTNEITSKFIDILICTRNWISCCTNIYFSCKCYLIIFPMFPHFFLFIPFVVLRGIKTLSPNESTDVINKDCTSSFRLNCPQRLSRYIRCVILK